MTRSRFQECAVETSMVIFSVGFLLWYIAAKLAVWSWGIWNF